MPYSFSRKASRSPWSWARWRSNCGVVVAASCSARRNEAVSGASALDGALTDIGGCTVRRLSRADIGHRFLVRMAPVTTEIGLRNDRIAPHLIRCTFRDLASEIQNVD